MGEITWEKAWSVWADKVSSSVSAFGPRSLMYYSSAGSMYFSKAIIPHIFNELGGYTGTKGSLCSSIGSSGLKDATLGWGVPFLTPELQSEARGIMLWGRNSIVTQPQIRQVFRKVREKGGEIASLEIRRTETLENQTGQVHSTRRRFCPGCVALQKTDQFRCVFQRMGEQGRKLRGIHCSPHQP